MGQDFSCAHADCPSMHATQSCQNNIFFLVLCLWTLFLHNSAKPTFLSCFPAVSWEAGAGKVFICSAGRVQYQPDWIGQSQWGVSEKSESKENIALLHLLWLWFWARGNQDCLAWSHTAASAPCWNFQLQDLRRVTGSQYQTVQFFPQIPSDISEYGHWAKASSILRAHAGKAPGSLWL